MNKLDIDMCMNCGEALATVADLYCQPCVDDMADAFWLSQQGIDYAAQIDAEAAEA